MLIEFVSNHNSSMLKTTHCLLLFIVGFMFFIPASAQKVQSDFNTNTDFSKFKTYAWLAPGDSVLNRADPRKLFGGYIEKDANHELQTRGMKLVKEQPDAIFIFYTSVEEITKYSQSPTLSVGVAVGVGYPGYYGPAYYAGGSVPVAGGKVTSTTEEDGTLGYSMYDAKTGKLVWNASVDKTFKLSDDIAKIIEDYTIKIFKKYPVKKSK